MYFFRGMKAAKLAVNISKNTSRAFSLNIGKYQRLTFFLCKHGGYDLVPRFRRHVPSPTSHTPSPQNIAATQSHLFGKYLFKYYKYYTRILLGGLERKSRASITD